MNKFQFYIYICLHLLIPFIIMELINEINITLIEVMFIHLKNKKKHKL